MDASEVHDKLSRNLLDQIAADPDMINRPLPKPGGELKAPAEQLAEAEATPPVVLLHPDEHLPANPPSRGHNLVLLVVIVSLLLMLSGGGAAAYLWLRPVVAPVVHLAVPTATASPTPSVTPTPSASPTPSPTVSPTPSPTPSRSVSPTPSASPTPSVVLGDSTTNRSAMPTPPHPQIVTVTNSSGLWLRSTPSSASQRNIVAWIPKDAQISVDSVGSFWWHGTYGGQSGYFAVRYTK